ncbi:unnamed protein product [[Candida] boidinii]|nr:unnamed protein product [[Candida] boidinii]
MSIPAASQATNLDYSSKSTNSSTVIHIPDDSPTKQKIDWTIKRPDWSLEKNISICKFTTEAKNKITTATSTANKNLKRSISKVFKGEQRDNYLRCIEDSQILQDVQESQDSQVLQDKHTTHLPLMKKSVRDRITSLKVAT